jgi:hypothetical protein
VNLSATVIVNRSAGHVFDFVMDLPRDALWRSSVVEASFTSDGPVDVGTALALAEKRKG